MSRVRVDTKDIKTAAAHLRAGDEVFLTGTVYTARDAAHKKIFELIKQGQKLPFDLDGAVVYYAGPTPTKPGAVIGSCGPTTSSRMDVYTPKLLSLGLCAMIGKGQRSDEVCESLRENGAVYLCAIGGAGALVAGCVKSLEVIAFEELGCESVKKLYVEDMPLICAIDCVGGNLYKR